MHIPDGYLSPSTCATLYAAATPFWWIALRRARRVLNSRVIPLLAVFSAFAFVIMMFNLPLPGGTTGHAVGMGVASIVLGPWISVLAISTALLIQALLFGDGGITAFGANCFNMAIVGSLTAYLVYRVIAYKSALVSARRAVAAGLAGYCAINLAALCAAVEFGLQPLLFHTSDGTPLYAPYPLSIAVPAMMAGHLTLAGLAEFVISAGLVSYLQRSDPALLRDTASDAPDRESVPLDLPPKTRFPLSSSPQLWAVLGLFLVLTPLGILAAGSAWGEWRPADFKDPAARAAIKAASSHISPPRIAPSGIERLSQLWLAPLPGYAPAFIRNAGVGYFIAASIGAGTIILLVCLTSAVVSRLPRKRIRKTFLEKSIDSLLHTSEEALFAESIAQRDGLLQKLDPRIKIVGLGALVFAAIAAHYLWVVAILFAFAALIALVSHIPLRILATRVWLGVLVFTGVVALPAIFLTPGITVAILPLFGWTLTRQGLHSAILLLLRAETAATFVLALLSTTRWNQLLRALRIFRVPTPVIVILQMTYRYIFVCLQSAQELFEARRARLLGPIESTEERNSAAAISGALLDRSLALSSDVHLAMQARGFRGEIQLLDDLVLAPSHWLPLGFFLLLATLLIWLGW